ncbi:MAG: metallophosphoesterase [Granulosicoccus sp.]|nr:metallophosphoesterase [Granulosicoccus sp.]
MRLVCISDTHGDHELLDLPEGDVLIHAGDLTGHGQCTETQSFMSWFGRQPFTYKLCIAGNHDTFMEAEPALTRRFAEDAGVLLLNDSGCEIDGVAFWGSPITPRYYDWSFMRDPGASIEAHWELIPNSTDVLITHGPPHGILDQVQRAEDEFEHTGCPSLLRRIREVAPRIHLFGHIHEGHGQFHANNLSYFNVSTMNKEYRIAHAPVIIDLANYSLRDSV